MSEARFSKCTNETPYEAILRWANTHPERVFLKQMKGQQFECYTFSQVAEQALCLVSALHALGLNAGDKIAILSKNCAEWFITDLALMLGDFTSIPIFPTASEETIEFTLTHSGCRAIFVGKLDDAHATQHVLAQHAHLITIRFPYSSAPKTQHTYQECISSHRPTTFRPEHHDTSMMSIIYTSGTSGTPKGAILQYGAFSWTSQMIIEALNIQSSDRLFSYLPLAHITERVYIFGSAVLTGAQTAFAESLDSFIHDVKAHEPTLFISVPRLWMLFQQRILDKLPQKRLEFLLKLPFINTLIRKKIANNLGLHKARILGCGSAPVSPALLKWYESLNLPITEAWGMTETLAYSTLNYPYRSDKVGTVGAPGKGVELRIENHEVWVKSKGLFSGYYQDEQTSQTMLTTDGWMKTGDLGSLDADGYLTLAGRVKDTFKTAKGKFVSPVPIEKKLYDMSRVEMLCLIGLGLPQPILLVVPHHIPNFDRARYERSANRILSQVNQDLAKHEKIQGILMIETPWSIENGLLTPTLKIKRHVLEKKYHAIGMSWPQKCTVLWESELELTQNIDP